MATSLDITATVGEPSAACGGGGVARRRHLRRADRKLAAAKLNDIGASLIDHEEYDRAIEILRDSVEVLTARKDGLHGGYSLEVAKAEACLSRAKRAKKTRDRVAAIAQGGRRSRRQSSSGGSGGESSSAISASSPDCPFGFAGSIRVSTAGDAARCSSADELHVGGQGLLVVLLYNLALAHNILGSRKGREALVDKAAALYKMSETVLLRQAAEDPDSLFGVDVTYLARAIVNNMGIVLFEWGKPEAGREYFDGLSSICFDDDNANAGDAEGESSAPRRRGGRWNAFEVNALIARGVNAAPSA